MLYTSFIHVECFIMCITLNRGYYMVVIEWIKIER